MVLCGDFVNGGYIFPLAMFPTLMKCATLDGPFVWMLISDTRAMGSCAGSCMGRFSVTCFIGLIT